MLGNETVGQHAFRGYRVLVNAVEGELRLGETPIVFQPGRRPLHACGTQLVKTRRGAPETEERRFGRQHVFELGRIRDRAQFPPRVRQLKGISQFCQCFLRQADIGLERSHLARGHALLRPDLVRPQPVVVERMRLEDPFEDPAIHVLHDVGIGRVSPGGDESGLQFRRHAAHPGLVDLCPRRLQAQRQLGPHRGRHAENACVTERFVEHRTHGVEDRVAARDIGRQRLPQHVGPVPVGREELARTAVELVGIPGVEGPGLLPVGMRPGRRIGPLHRAIGRNVLGQTDPHRGLGATPHILRLVPLGIVTGVSMKAEEVHPQLGKLRDDREIVRGIPEVRTRGKVVVGLDAARRKTRNARFVDAGNVERDRRVRDRVEGETETDPEMLGIAIGPLQSGRRVVTTDDEHLSPVVDQALQNEAARTTRRRQQAVEVAQDRISRGRHHHQVSGWRQRRGHGHVEQAARAEIKVATHLACREFDGRFGAIMHDARKSCLRRCGGTDAPPEQQEQDGEETIHSGFPSPPLAASQAADRSCSSRDTPASR